jgi:hypothetical protein
MISTLSTEADVEGGEDDLDVPDLVARSPSDLDDSDSDEEDDYQPPRIPPKCWLTTLKRPIRVSLQ